MFFLKMVLLSLISHADIPAASCPTFSDRFLGTQIQQIWSKAAQKCYFTVTPNEGYVDMIYRDHLLSSDGQFLVFNSYGSGSQGSSVGSRSFMLFPRSDNPYVYQWNEAEQILQVRHVNGSIFTFDARKAHLLSISGASVTVADYVVPSNKGGIEILNYAGIWIDNGFVKGGAATSNPNGISKIKDAQNRECQVKNKEIFKYTREDVVFKFSDIEFIQFLKNRCPALKNNSENENED